MDKSVISFEEKRKIQLEMLKEVDTYCRANKLRYSLAYGTLLGAVRHKGFIPWDDDMDIMMPLPDLIRFKKSFKSEIARYCDVDNQKYYEFAFPKIVHNLSYSQYGIRCKSYGIHIDLYPVLGLPETREEISFFLDEGTKIMKKRLFLMKWRNRIIERIPIRTIPFYHYFQKKFRNYLFQYPYNNSNYYFCYGGELEWRNVYNYDIFTKVIDLPFEGDRYMAVSCYDDVLTQFYGDYMTPPPVEERIPYHGGQYYWYDGKI